MGKWTQKKIKFVVTRDGGMWGELVEGSQKYALLKKFIHLF